MQEPSVIRQVSASGTVSTLASPAFGHADGSGTTARLGKVAALAVAPDRSIYLIDDDTNATYLRHLTRDGNLTTLATLTPALISLSPKLVVDSHGNVTVLGWWAVYRVSGGRLTLTAGTEQGGAGSVDGEGTAARFTEITDGAVDSAGNLYLLDNFSIRKMTPDGTVSTLAGIASTSATLDGAGSAARFGNPLSLALNASGNLLVLDRDINASGYLIRQVTPAGVVTTPYRGSDPTSGSLAAPGVETPDRRLTVTSNNTIVLASTGELRVQQTATSATLLAGLEGGSGDEIDGQGAAARFVSPALLAADLSGNVFVLDRAGAFGGHAAEPLGVWLRKITPGGLVTSIPTGDSMLIPTAMYADGDGNLYISVRWPLDGLTGVLPGGLIYKITPQGTVSILAGSGKPVTPAAPVDGAGAKAAFTQPTLKGIDAAGNLYVSDLNPYVTPAVTTYRKVTPQGAVTTISALPSGLDQAPDGNVYTTDALASVVYRLAADGSKTVAAGVANSRGTRLGTLPGGLDVPAAVVPTGPGSFAVISGSAVLRLVVPH